MPRRPREKNLDLLVANRVGAPGTGFGTDTNLAAILASTGEDVPLRSWTKADLARVVWDRVSVLLAGGAG